jgi:hypothetical protein
MTLPGAVGGTNHLPADLELERLRFWPTPTARDWKSGKGKTQAERGQTAGPSLSEASGGSLNPQWVEWLMGFPLGWTDLEDLETQ